MKRLELNKGCKKNINTMKLTSLTDFVLELIINYPQQIDETHSEYRSRRLSLIENYAKFLKQPLTLGMFVPCDEEGNVLEEPDIQIGGVEKYSEKYQQARERVLFEGFELVEKREIYESINRIIIDLDSQTFIIEGSLGIGGGYLIDETIEDLATLGLTLNPSAIKQLGL